MTDLLRREFIALAAIVPGVVQAAALKTLSASDAKWLEAIMAQIVPSDDAPGARETGCIYYLDHQLAGPLKRYTDAYAVGLKAFREKHPDFLDKSPASQIETLQSVEKSAFFEMLLDHTMQAFYGSSTHGGNKDEASWKMLGIDKHMSGGHWHGA